MCGDVATLHTFASVAPSISLPIPEALESHAFVVQISFAQTPRYKMLVMPCYTFSDDSIPPAYSFCCNTTSTTFTLLPLLPPLN